MRGFGGGVLGRSEWLYRCELLLLGMTVTKLGVLRGLEEIEQLIQYTDRFLNR